MERAVRLLGALVLVAVAAGAFTPLAHRINVWMAGPARLEPAAAIVVLARGGADGDGVLTNRSLRRTLHGVALARRGLAPLLVLSGSDAEARGRVELARGLGLPADAILEVLGARTTREEVDELARLLLPRGARRVLLVVDPLDMPRARALLVRAGFDVLPAPTGSPGPGTPDARLGFLRDVLLELLAWSAYRAAGTL